jgi:signal transduction histidine kinase
MLELQLSTMKRLEATGQTEMVSSIIQEFRQPLSSILGYTDLLLGETIGLPGAEQRKFLERVKASTERLSILVNDLIEVLAIDRGSLDQTTDKIDLVALINGVVENMNAQTSEKKISFRMDLPEKPLEIRIDPEALHQIVANLLENAWLVTPEEGEISLCAGVEEKDSHPSFLRIAVTDQGGGIQQADLQSVFTRRYKMEHPLIQGIGDTGVGLSIVKSLVELHKGRVWIDTQEGLGSTFSVLMPLVEDQPETVNLPNP